MFIFTSDIVTMFMTLVEMEILKIFAYVSINDLDSWICKWTDHVHIIDQLRPLYFMTLHLAMYLLCFNKILCNQNLYNIIPTITLFITIFC